MWNGSGTTLEWLWNDSGTTLDLITTVTKNFVILQAGGKASKYGSYKCDSPKILVESAFKAMKNLVPDPEFILWTGDSDPKSIIPFENSNFLNFSTSKYFTKKLMAKPSKKVIHNVFLMIWGHFSCQHSSKLLNFSLNRIKCIRFNN